MFVSITEDNTTVMVSILQKCRREKEKGNVFMGLEIHQVPDEYEVRYIFFKSTCIYISFNRLEQD